MKSFFKKDFDIDKNLIQFNIEDKTVKEVVDFYTEAPFPNYESSDDKSSINFKGLWYPNSNILSNTFIHARMFPVFKI